MKLRKFEFKKVDMWDEDPEGKPQPIGELDYRQTAKQILLRPMPGAAGLSGEEMENSLDIWTAIQEAVKSGQDYVYLEKKQWEYFRDRVKAWKWGFANVVAQDFKKYVENILEEEVKLQKAE